MLKVLTADAKDIINGLKDLGHVRVTALVAIPQIIVQ